MRKYCNNEKMGLVEYAEKFKLKHTYIPEPYYAKLAMLDGARMVDDPSMVTNGNVLDSARPTELAPTTAAAAVAPNDQGPKKPDVPRLLLRCESLTGSGETWINVAKRKTDHQVSGTKTNSQPSNQSTEALSTAQAKSNSAMSSTRLATETAVTNMFNVIRATFKPTSGVATLAQGNFTAPKSAPVPETEMERSKPSSSASRVIGINKGQRNI